MKKFAWLITLAFIILGWIAAFHLIEKNGTAFLAGWVWTAFWILLYGLATAKEYNDPNMEM